MRKGDRLPISRASDPLLPTALDEMSKKGVGMTCIVDDGGKLLGIFTDGDLRRLLVERDGVKAITVGEVMHKGPISIAPGKLATEAARILEQKGLGGRLVVLDDAGRLVGAVTFHDLLAAGVV